MVENTMYTKMQYLYYYFKKTLGLGYIFQIIQGKNIDLVQLLLNSH